LQRENLVEEYVRNRDPRLREQIIADSLPLVKYVLGRMRLTTNKTDLEDIQSAGIIGLLNALEEFNLNKNTKFSTYATWKIRGAILDYLRKIDFVSRGDRAKLRQIENTVQQLMASYGRPPRDQEVADELNIDLSEYDRLMEMVQVNYAVSFDQQQNVNGEQVQLSDIIPDDDTDGPMEQFQKKTILGLVKQAIKKLPERERVIVVMYYYDEMTMAEIGTVLGLSESRVSRLLGRAILTIRQRIEGVNQDKRVAV